MRTCANRVIVRRRHHMTPDQIKDWIKTTNRSRESLAEELGYSKRTVDNWFTAGDVPLPAIQHIRRIRLAEQQGEKLRFSLEEWDQIEAARKLAGYEDRGQFMVDALTSFAYNIAKQSSANYLSIVPEDSSKVAEDGPEDPPPPPARPAKKR
jgi:DNA-binding transcriptional regulator YiaG